MPTIFPPLRSFLPLPEQFDRLVETCWQEAGALLLAVGAIAVMSLVQAVRSR